MSATSISVARILQLRVPIAWQEAVELARVAHQHAESSGVPLLLDQCVISIDGSVHLIPSSTGGRPGAPLTLLGFLGVLIEGQDAPSELRALVDGVGEPPSEALTPTGAAVPQRFDLSWFTSPRPEVEIARLAARGIEALAAHDAQAAIQQLRSDVADAPPPAQTPPSSPTANRRKLLRPLAIAAAVVLLITAGVAVRGLTTPRVEPAVVGEVPPAETKSFLDSAFDSLKRALAPSGDSAPAATDATAADAAASGAKAGSGRGRVSGPPASASTPAAAAGSGSVSTPAAPAPSGGYGEVTTMDQVVVRGTSPRVYTQRDAGVEPPAFVYPQMPSEPRGDTLTTDSHIEVMVDEQGRVTQVRLRSTDASLNDRMIVAAAKAWQFRPALKDGQPVPYVLQVPVIR